MNGFFNPAEVLPSSEQCAEVLQASGDFRVLRRMETDIPSLTEPVPALPGTRRGIVIDAETTGRDALADKLVEIGMVLFDFVQETGEIARIVGCYEELEDPGIAIPPEASRVNGITHDMVAGHQLDDGRIVELVQDTDLMIAHNASFDRKILEARLPVFADKAWACSQAEIDWEAEGIGGQKLDYIAYRYGFFYDAHRAAADCLALLNILRQPLPTSGIAGLKALTERAGEADIVVYAEGAPYEAKDLLKKRGYRWTEKDVLAKGKAWGRALKGDLAVWEEFDWLRDNIYHGQKFAVGLERLDWLTRHSARPGEFSREFV